MRIARALALAGINSRRKCEDLIRRGEVTVNGEVIFDLGRQVDMDTDEIIFRGKHIHFEKYVYYIVNKPAGYTTTASDPHAVKTVFELLPSVLVPKTNKPMPSRTRVFPVGRLDKASTGLILFTNDGDLANQMTHPRYGVGKWYEVRLDKALDPRDARRLTKGVQLEEGMAQAERVQPLTKRIIRLLIREGKKREVRRMFEAVGYEVVELCRIAFGPLMLGGMPIGSGRYLNPTEIRRLKEAVAVSSKKNS